MMDDKQQSGAPPPDPQAKVAPTELMRLVHLFRHWKEDPADRFLFDLVSRYRGGESP